MYSYTTQTEAMSTTVSLEIMNDLLTHHQYSIRKIQTEYNINNNRTAVCIYRTTQYSERKFVQSNYENNKLYELSQARLS